MIQTESIQVAQAVAHYGSFTVAAQHLHKVPSAISYTVRKLEEQLGVQLFVRDSKRVALTPAGEHFLKHAGRLLDKVRQLEDSTRQVAQGYERELRIAIDNVVNQGVMYDLIRAFNQAFPTTRLVVNGEIYIGCWDALFHQRCQLAIGAPQTVPEIIPGQSRFDFRSMGLLEWELVMSPDHPLAQADAPLTAEQLRDFLTITIEDSARYFRPGENWLDDNPSVLAVPNFRNAIECAMQGIGVTTLPRHFARYYLDRGLLVGRAIHGVPWNTTCHVAWNDEVRGPALEWCLDWLGDSERLNHCWLTHDPDTQPELHIP